MDNAISATTDAFLSSGQSFYWSRHADRQAARRGISADAVAHCLRWGLLIHQDGATVHYLGRRSAPEGTPEGWLGVTVVLSRDGRIITIFKRRDGIPRKLRRRGHLGPIHV